MLPVLLEMMALLDRKGLRVTKDRRALLVLLALLEMMVLLDRRVLRVLPDRKVIKDRKV